MKEQVICRFAKFTPKAIQYKQVDPCGEPIKRDREGLVVGNIYLRKAALKVRKHRPRSQSHWNTKRPIKTFEAASVGGLFIRAENANRSIGLPAPTKRTYISGMLLRARTRRTVGFVEPCLPSPAKAPPAGPGWIHEIKRGHRPLAAEVHCAFDLLELDGEDLRRSPIEARKRALAKLLRGAHESLALNVHYEADGAIVHREACRLGCEGIVSKRLGSLYRSGRSGSFFLLLL